MKKLILWNYSRGTWQYDIFCLMIVAFIFLTPQTWFRGIGKTATPNTDSVVKAQDFSADQKLAEINGATTQTEQ